MQADVVKRNRQDNDGAERNQYGGDCCQGEAQRDQGQLDETALFLLLVDDVEGVEDRLHPGICAPERDGQAHYETEAELRVSFRSQPIDLVPDDTHPAFGQKPAAADKCSLMVEALANRP